MTSEYSSNRTTEQSRWTLRFRLRSILLATFLVALVTTFLLSIYGPWKKEQALLAKNAERIEYLGIQYEGPRVLQPYMQRFPWYNRVWEVTLTADSELKEATQILDFLSQLSYLEEVVLLDSDSAAALAKRLQQESLVNVHGLPIIIEVIR